MPKIAPSVIKNMRKLLKLSQTELAIKAKIDKQTVCRLESGKQTNANRTTVARLCEAFSNSLNADVTAVILSGDAPMPTRESPQPAREHKSQLNLRIDDAARNALDLVARRYKVRPSQIIEIAPLLFLSAAEASLQQRRDRIAALQAIVDDPLGAAGLLPHLNDQFGYSHIANEVISAEKNSIDKRDLFGEKIGADTQNSEALRPDYDEETQNPFSVFLNELAKKLANLGTFESWAPHSSPDYRVCHDEAALYVDGDLAAADAILRGEVLLSEMRKDPNLRKEEAAPQRAEWLRQHRKHEAGISDLMEFIEPVKEGSSP
jgi:transcriptional regulator with XRE-family HTH domain